MQCYSVRRTSTILILYLLSSLAIQIRSEVGGDSDSFVSLEAWYPSKDQYAVGSTFESNLRRVMSNLAHNTSETGFNVSSYGQIPNKVYGLLQCRANISQQQCYQCANNVTRYAIGSLHHVCNNSIKCQIWFDEMCYLRYANYSFSSVNEDSDSSFSVSEITVPAKIQTQVSRSLVLFKSTLEKLVYSLSAVASQATSRGFAAGSSKYSTPSVQMIDAFVECSRDLSSTNCTACLSKGFQRLVFFKYLGAQIRQPNCIIRYISTEPGNYSADVSASNKLPTMWGLIRGILLVILGFMCA